MCSVWQVFEDKAALLHLYLKARVFIGWPAQRSHPGYWLGMCSWYQFNLLARKSWESLVFSCLYFILACSPKPDPSQSGVLQIHWDLNSQSSWLAMGFGNVREAECATTPRRNIFLTRRTDVLIAMNYTTEKPFLKLYPLNLKDYH